MTRALLDNWVVMSVPDARELVDGTTAYAPVQGSQPVQYVQKAATAQLLDRVAKANEAVLSKLHVSRQHPELKSTFDPKMSLQDLAIVGSEQPDVAWPAFRALWSELTATSATKIPTGGFQPFKPRPPMLITVDGISHWMQTTKYFSPEFKPIHAHDFVFINHFLSLCSNPASSMPNGGVALFATSFSNNPSVRTFDVGLAELHYRCHGQPLDPHRIPTPGPYETLDPRTR
ncbi:predicted protein [Uncinocarpus reesii 1704]|uniref:Small ribosomal subunit protein mS29 n=1 Tax=Uncinocarpus reesii (strain UAMH 1704) TaxID=336963 RepID=C4JZY3_UNCRE|nr:uncharacterized protein UREG_07734 [Uncinocarpus reesii 1704]EEP82869.1 predicted protein [Uncinocarpus reesii 1704]